MIKNLIKMKVIVHIKRSIIIIIHFLEVFQPRKQQRQRKEKKKDIKKEHKYLDNKEVARIQLLFI